LLRLSTEITHARRRQRRGQPDPPGVGAQLQLGQLQLTPDQPGDVAHRQRDEIAD